LIAQAQISEVDTLMRLFRRFTTPEIVRIAVSQPSELWRRPERRVLTTFFADIRDFTPFVARVSPEEATATVNAILGCIIDAIESEGGVVNRFLGDGILALFDTSSALGNHACLAAAAALKAREGVELLAAERRLHDHDPLRIGIGINSGELVVCCIGTRERTAHTVIGHAVNVAARLVAVAEPGEILLGAGTVALLHPRFEVRERAVLQLKGVGATSAAQLIGMREDLRSDATAA
jgi:adenylate cyclase